MSEEDQDLSFGGAIDQIVAEKGISKDKVLETIEAALAAAFRKDYGERGQDVRAEFNEDDGSARVFKVVTVVDDEEVENEVAQISLTEAKKEDKEAELGKEYVEEVTPDDPNYGRVAAQTAKQVIIQRIREAEREAVHAEYKDKEGEIISGIVQRIEGDTVFVDIGRTTGILLPSEQVRGERYRVNQRIRVYVVKVELSSRGPDISLSRSHPGMLRRLFELEVPEIFAGSVEIKGIAREASERSKVSVWAKEEGIDPVGACIGQRGTRIQTIIAELSGEKIDIIQWDEDHARYIANALSPARVIAVDAFEDEKRAVAHVDESQLSLAIGKRGQNVRLAAKLSGWRIDIVKAGEEEAVEAGATPEESIDETQDKETPDGKKDAKASADDETKSEGEDPAEGVADPEKSEDLGASETSEDPAEGIADDTKQTNEQPAVGEDTEEGAVDPAEKEANKEEAEASASAKASPSAKATEDKSADKEADAEGKDKKKDPEKSDDLGASTEKSAATSAKAKADKEEKESDTAEEEETSDEESEKSDDVGTGAEKSTGTSAKAEDDPPSPKASSSAKASADKSAKQEKKKE